MVSKGFRTNKPVLQSLAQSTFIYSVGNLPYIIDLILLEMAWNNIGREIPQEPQNNLPWGLKKFMSSLKLWEETV